MSQTPPSNDHGLWLSIIVGTLASFCAAAFFSVPTVGYSDRTIVQSADGHASFVIQDDRSLTARFWFAHRRTVYYRVGNVSGKTVDSFWSSKHDPEPYGNAVSISNSVNHETTEKSFAMVLDLPDIGEVEIVGSKGTADFITKTDPDYFRYVSMGSGTVTVSGVQIPAHTAVDSTVYRDLEAAYLKPDTSVNGYFWVFWDASGTARFFDISEMVKRGVAETYEPHRFLLEERADGSLLRSEKLEFDSPSAGVWKFDFGTGSGRSIEFSTVESMGSERDFDRYYSAVGKDSKTGMPVYGVLNFLDIVGSR